MTLIFVALGLYLAGGIFALATTNRPNLSSLLGALGAVSGGAVGLFSAARALAGAEGGLVAIATESLFGGRILVGLDPLTGFFLVPVFAIGALAALYGREYMRSYATRRWLGPPWLAFDVLLAAIVVVLVARDALTFMFAWEIMSVAAYVLVSFEHEVESTRRAGLVYIVAAHVTMALLLAMFMLYAREAGSLELAAMAAVRSTDPTFSTTIFLLALVGFGIKAGFVPVHVWLPEAHAAAPSHVSAILSGVLLKMGIYGLLRVLFLLGTAATWWGPLLIVLGVGGGIFGISIAIYQRDMKRVLAYSSVENVSIIALGLGLGLWGVQIKSNHVAVLGFTGALLHVWNHALMKSLLFLGAGSVLHATKTKDLSRLGGLLRVMPKTGALMIVGAVAISALPPLNGFVGEWLLYSGLIDGAQARAHTASGITALLAVGAFALMGTLAALCFVRLVGMAFLGEARSPDVGHAHEAAPGMLAPMTALAALSVLVAIFPGFVAAQLQLVVRACLGSAGAKVDVLSTLGLRLDTLGMVNGVTWGVVIFVALVLRTLLVRNGSTTDSTWGCGYVAPTARMQYVPGSFAELFAEHLLPKVFRAKVRRETERSLFEPKVELATDGEDPMTRGVYEPFLSRWAGRFSRVRWFQQGHVHLYLIYILVVLLLGLAWMSVRSWR